MPREQSSLRGLIQRLATGATTPKAVAQRALECADSNISKRFIWRGCGWEVARGRRGWCARFAGGEKPALCGLPVLLKVLVRLIVAAFFGHAPQDSSARRSSLSASAIRHSLRRMIPNAH